MELERNVRSFGRVIWLSIITFGIYYFVYLFKTLNEMENAFTFASQEIAPRKVRLFLIVYLVVTIILSFIGAGLRGFLETTFTTEGFFAWEIIGTSICMSLAVAFWVPFVKLIEACQIKREITSLNKEIIWILLTVTVALPFAYIIGTKALALLNVPVSLVFFYLIVKQINRIWKGV